MTQESATMWRCWLLLCVCCVCTHNAHAQCGAAQWRCASGACVRSDAYCDGTQHCDDNSDEPPRCTTCNRTYHGEAGRLYALTVRPTRAPHTCHLTFAAGGGALGDIVQLTFERFRVGRYEPDARDPCPDGYMQVSELGRPFTGGSWCGEAAGAALYYSETATVTVSLRLVRMRPAEPIEFSLQYKFLRRRDAVVRFGAPEAPLELGAVAPGTYCTRTYEECHRKSCRIQSPNYPGMYPRNVTCYWSLRQKDIPTCKHAMISVRQEYSHKMQIKRSISIASLNKTHREVRAWRECTGERDRLLVYDGASTDDPVLVEYCGGDWLPTVTARGPDMLVAFHSAPYSATLAHITTHALRGFELDVDVAFADSDSLDYAREARRCEFHVKASSSEEEGNVTAAVGERGRRGRLRAPAHTLPPNTTCTWTFHGRPGDLVWIYFSSFTHYSLVEARRSDSEEESAVSTTPRAAPASDARTCAVELHVWEGDGAGEEGARALAHLCDAPPTLCARAALANATRAPRPCAPPDGYVTTSPLLSLSVTSRPGTATHPLRFSLHYEFVDARLDGAPLYRADAVPAQCARVLSTPGAVTSPRNVLWYGRGGARRMRCVYRLYSDSARVTLHIHTAQFGHTQHCVTRTDTRTGRLVCTQNTHTDDTHTETQGDDETSLRVPHLVIYESPWVGYRVPLACLCDNTSTPLRLHSEGGALELELVSRALHAAEDHRHVHFRGDWSRSPAPSPACAQRRRLPPPGDRLYLTYPYSNDRMSECGETPFLLEARGNRSVFVRVWGEDVTAQGDGEGSACATTNRVLVYTRAGHLVRAVCPGGARDVRLFSDEWWGRGGAGSAGGALLVVWAAREAGEARFSWMEVWRARGDDAHNATAACAHSCASVGACVSARLWCDGARDCPGGEDEGEQCGAGARLLGALGAPAGAGAAAALVAAAALALFAAALLRRRRRGDKRASGAARRFTDELLHDASRASSTASS